jgi:hypothetical protein
VVAGGAMFIVGYVGASSIYERTHERMAAGLMALIVILFVEMALFVIKETRAPNPGV